MVQLRKTSFIFIVLIVAFIFSGCTSTSTTPSSSTTTANRNTVDTNQIKINESLFDVEVLTTNEQRQKGLSNRESLPQNHALLFVFPDIGIHGIWMIDMLFPIDIVWVDESKRVVGIKENALPESYPEIFYPIEPAKYVIEFNSGIIQEHNIKIGDKLEIL